MCLDHLHSKFHLRNVSRCQTLHLLLNLTAYEPWIQILSKFYSPHLKFNCRNRSCLPTTHVSVPGASHFSLNRKTVSFLLRYLQSYRKDEKQTIQRWGIRKHVISGSLEKMASARTSQVEVWVNDLILARQRQQWRRKQTHKPGLKIHGVFENLEVQIDLSLERRTGGVD